MTLKLFLGAWGKMIHEKNQKQKISWHCPFNYSSIWLSHISYYLATWLSIQPPISLFLATMFVLSHQKASNFFSSPQITYLQIPGLIPQL